VLASNAVRWYPQNADGIIHSLRLSGRAGAEIHVQVVDSSVQWGTCPNCCIHNLAPYVKSTPSVQGKFGYWGQMSMAFNLRI
jgi:hypothetical protein